MNDINEFIHKWLMKTALGFVGHRPDFYIRDYATQWYAKGKLDENDLFEIDTAIEAQYAEPEPTEPAPADPLPEEVPV